MDPKHIDAAMALVDLHMAGRRYEDCVAVLQRELATTRARPARKDVEARMEQLTKLMDTGYDDAGPLLDVIVFKGAGEGACLNCTLGRFTEEEGESECKLAPAGTYVNVTRAKKATDCAAGRYSDMASRACAAGVGVSFFVILFPFF